MTHHPFVKAFVALAGIFAFASTAAGCGSDADTVAKPSPSVSPSAAPSGSASPSVAPSARATASPKTDDASPTAGKSSPSPSRQPSAGGKPSTSPGGASVTVVANAQEVTVLVNKTRKLPDGYEPPDLVEPNVPFTFAEKNERRLMRKEAAKALEELFAAANRDGIEMKAVSGYRSYAVQKSLFNYYVRTQGEQRARQYSAEPGHSEHQTGLAMDVSSASVDYALEESFANTKEGKWLAAHAAEFGFIIRYPKGKEAITGYNYEPWHIRYVGKNIAREIAANGLALEEYAGAAKPVNQGG